MDNQFKLSAQIQNIYSGNSVSPKVKHNLPDFSSALTGKDSVVLTLTGTGTHTLVNDGTNFNYNAGTLLTHPITGAVIEIASNQVLGFGIYVTRAASGTAPTGNVLLGNTGFCGWATDGDITLKENSFFLCHNPSGPATTDSTGLTISLSGTTGYKVLVIAYCN